MVEESAEAHLSRPTPRVFCWTSCTGVTCWGSIKAFYQNAATLQMGSIVIAQQPHLQADSQGLLQEAQHWRNSLCSLGEGVQNGQYFHRNAS